jgi:hypothetical protein
MAMEAKYLSDAAHFPGGHFARVEIPRTIPEIPEIARRAETLLPIGAQSSLTGGVNASHIYQDPRRTVSCTPRRRSNTSVLCIRSSLLLFSHRLSFRRLDP